MRARTSRPSASAPSGPAPPPGASKGRPRGRRGRPPTSGPRKAMRDDDAGQRQADLAAAGAQRAAQDAGRRARREARAPFAGPASGVSASHGIHQRGTAGAGSRAARDVGDDVEEDVEDGEQDDDVLDHRHVAAVIASTNVRPMPGVGEDRLDQDDAAGQVEQVQPDDLDDRGERVRQRVAEGDPATSRRPSAGRTRRSRSRAPRSSPRGSSGTCKG